jgi:MoxR-like ATPase
VHLTRNAQIALSFNLAQNTVTFTVIGSALPFPTPAPTPAQAGNPFPEKVNRVPVLRKVQHTYRPPHMLKDIISVLADEASHPIWFKGPTGSGKTVAAHYIAKALGRQLFQINCHYGMGPESLVGERSISIDEKTGQNYISYIEGTVVKAMQCGLDGQGNEVGTPGLLFIDEAGAMPTQVAIMLNRLLESDDPRRTITLEHDGGRVIRSHSGFRLILAANTCGRGANTMAEAFYTAQTDALDISLLNRIAAVFKFGYDKEAEKAILLEKTNDRVANQVIRFRDAIRDALRAGRLSTPFSTRHIVKIADLYRIFNDIPKAIYLATMEQLLPQEMAIFNETIMAQFGKDIVKEITQDDVDYM